MTELPQFNPQRESIELTIGQKGGAGWTIKLLDINIDRLEELNNEMVKRFKKDKSGVDV